MTGEERDTRTRSLVADLFAQAARGSDNVVEALVELATDEPLARWALDVVLELEEAAAERHSGLPRATAEVDARLEGFVRALQTRP